MKSIWNAHITKISFIGLILQGNSISSAIINPLGTCQGRRSAVGVCIWASEAAVRTGMFHIFHTGMGGRVSRIKTNDPRYLLGRDQNVVTRNVVFIFILFVRLCSFFGIRTIFCMFRIEFVVFILRRCGLSPSAKVTNAD